MNTSENAAQNDWMQGMLGEFLDESDQLLGRLNENLLRLDALVQSEGTDDHPPCDEALLNEMFRSAHSLKGLSGMLGLSDINNLTHRLENVFDAARKEGLRSHRRRGGVDVPGGRPSGQARRGPERPRRRAGRVRHGHRGHPSAAGVARRRAETEFPGGCRESPGRTRPRRFPAPRSPTRCAGTPPASCSLLPAPRPLRGRRGAGGGGRWRRATG